MSFDRKGVSYVSGDDIAPCNMRKDAVEAYAEEVSNLTKFQIGDDPTEIALTLGGRIHFRDIDEWIDHESGSIIVHGFFDFDICLPTYTHRLRDKFTIAHELGHYFLHAEQGATPIIAYRRGSTRIEWEANWFAAALLMPRKQFREACREYPLERVASMFGVSQPAANVRKQSLGA